MKVPKNKIQIQTAENGEFVVKASFLAYAGKYYIFNGKYYAGNEYKDDAAEIIKTSNPEYKDLTKLKDISKLGLVHLNPKLRKFL
jgi:hypothetical protein